MTTERDFRGLSSAAQAELRRVAVNLVLSGKSRIEAAQAVGVNRRFVGKWVQAFEALSEAALTGGQRGAGLASRGRCTALVHGLFIGFGAPYPWVVSVRPNRDGLGGSDHAIEHVDRDGDFALLALS